MKPLGEYDVSKLSDKELDAKIIESGWASPHFIALSQERQRRQLEILKKPHWILWATLVAGAIAAIATVILLFR